jgi:Transposase DDE domain
MLPVPAPGHPPTLDGIERTLAALIRHLPLDPRTRGRPEVLPTAMLWAGILLCILRGTPTQRAVWRAVTGAGLWSYAPIAITPEGVRKRIAGLGPETIQAVFGQLTAHLVAHWTGDTRLAPIARGGVYALDDTTLDKVARTLPTADGPVRPLAGRLHTVFDVRRQCFQRVLPTDRAFENERTAARDLIQSLPRKSLVLLDRGFLSFPLYDQITAGRRFLVTRLSDTVSVRVRHVFTATPTVRDELVFLGAHRADRSRYAYRLITITTPAGTWRYLTNVRQPHQLSPAEIVALYARRWDIELAFKFVKRDLGLHLIWATSWAMIQIQIWATLLVAQVALVVRLQVALRAGVDLFDVSLRLLVQDLPHYLAQGPDDVVGAIVARGSYGGIIRPSRRKSYPVPTDLPVEPPPRGLRYTQTPRYAGKA